MNSERNPHLLSDPSAGCVIGSSNSGGPILGYGSPPGNHSGSVDMVGAQPCPVPTPPWVKPPSNGGNSGMMTPESDVSSCSSPASTSYGASSTTQQFPSQQQHLSNHPHLQHHQRSFYGSNNYSGCGGGSSNSSNSSSDPAGVHTTMNQIRGNHNSYCNSSTNNSNAISSSTNNGMFYDSTEIDQSQYYHQHHHQHHHNNPNHNSHHHHHPHNNHFHQQQQFDNSMHLQKTGSSHSSCASLENNVNLSGDMGGGSAGGNNPSSSGGTNFYGFYNQSGQYTDYHQHHHQTHQHHDSGYPSGGDNSGGTRLHHQFYRQDGNNTNPSANSVPVGHANYFNSSVPTPTNPNYPASPAGVVSAGTSTPPTVMPTRYGSPMMFSTNHSHQQLNSANNNSGYSAQQQASQHGQHLGQITMRRNSIESFSSEPGDMHSSYTARYGCNNTNNMNHQQIQQISNQSHHANNPFSISGSGNNSTEMIKRECISTGSSGGVTSRSSPSMTNMPPCTNTNTNTQTSWSSPHASQGGGGVQGYFPSPSPSNNCTSSSTSPNPCSNNSTSSRGNYLSNSYNSSGTCVGESDECGNASNSGSSFYSQHNSHHHHNTSQFKSCVYEQSQQHHDIKEGIQTLVGSSNNGGNMLKAASAVKHRSLSLSMPLPSYLENNESSRADLIDNSFVNHAHHQHRQFQQPHHHSHSHHHGFGPVMNSSQQHQQCATTGLVIPDQNLLTPNSDDDMPFRTASAGEQSDLDSSYETMGDEGCSSSTNASHCISMNTSGNSTCSGSSSTGVNNNGSSMATSHLNSMSVVTNEPDCHHHHHHGDISFSTPSSVSSCMQAHHSSAMSMGILEIPNSTVALCTNNVGDLDDSSSDSSDELHNVISAVVENSSIDTPENTMMGDEMNEDDHDVDHDSHGVEEDHDSSENNRTISGLVTNRLQHHRSLNQDNQTDVNVISTTTNEPDEEGIVDDNDNCSESSMSNINSSFTVDMFCDNNSADNTIDESGSDKADTNAINCNSTGNNFPAVSSEERNIADDEADNAENKQSASDSSSSSLLGLKSSLSSTSLPNSTIMPTSPQKISKRSFSETDKDHLVINTTTTSATTLTFGATFRKSCNGESGSPIIDASVNNNTCVSSNATGEDSANENIIGINSESNDNDTSNNNTTISNECKGIDIIISSSSSNGSGTLISLNSDNSGVSIPQGWKREILKGSSSDNGTSSGGNGTKGSGVLYISPSETKIRNLDELKNYIGADGTCKCGLSCPLRLEVAFSFDPKVTTISVEDEKENLELPGAARNDTSTSSSPSATASCANATGESDTRLLCNHKRKIPKAEDSPLISSTRDDLGDFGEKLKKRRLSVNECIGEKLISFGPFRKDPITTTSGANNSSNNSNNTTHNVPVPFCQQSPDTTTQTPQTEMSPASSVCSDSSTILFSSAGGGGSGGGNRSLTSTPTPTPSSSSASSSTSVVAGGTKLGSSPSQSQGHCEFVWPSPPAIHQTTNMSSSVPQQLPQNQSSTFWLNPTNSAATFSTNPIGSNSNNSLTLNYVQSPTTTSSCVPLGNVITTSLGISNSGNANATASASTTLPTTVSPTAANTTKKIYHPFSSKNVKRSSSPCPNIDVRQLPLELNRPPPIAVPSNSAKTPTPCLTNTIANLPLPVVTNSNIVFTVTPPQLVSAIKPEILSLANTTLPILPLLTTTGKLPTVTPIDTTPTIVATLQPSTSILSTIDANTLFAVQKENISTLTKIVTTASPQTQQQSVAVKVETVSNSVNSKASREQLLKSNEESNSKDEKRSQANKPLGKVVKATSQSGNATGEKSPLQLAQDIVDRFEKKSIEKNEAGKAVNNENNSSNISNVNATSKELPEVKEKSGTGKVLKSSKDSISGKQDKLTDVTARVTKTTTITDTLSSERKADRVKSEETHKSSVSETIKAEVVQAGDKSKIPVDSSTKPPIAFAIIASASATTPVNTVSSTQLPQQPQQQIPDTIITSQTPIMSTTPLILKDGLQLSDQGLTFTTSSVSAPIPTISLSAMGNQIIQTSGAPVSCSTTLTAGSLGTFASAGTNQIILHPSQQATDQANGANSTFLTTSAASGTSPIRYPILQTIHPFFLNSAGHSGGPLIFSQHQSQDPTHNNPMAQQSFIYDQNGTPTATIDGMGAFQSMIQPATTTMVLDPSICAGNPNLAGGKKKKKRLSKKQQQQQAQLQLQQQLILQQLQAQQQQAAAAAATIPLTIFPQSFNLGPQGFSLQPTMNFFPTPTYLTLPNLILNPADGTLFIQPSTPLPTATTAPMQQTTMKLGQFPYTTTTTIPQNPQNIAPKKDGNIIIHNLNEPLKPASTPGLDPGSDDSRQNPTPDSSTNDLQLGLLNVANAPPQTNTITLNIPAPTTTTVLHNPNPVVNKKSSKSRTVSSSSTTVKRILPQKQILPKIDSTTPSTTENAN